MKTKWGKVSRGLCFGFAALAVLACMTAIGWNTILAYAKNTWPGSSTAWYSTPATAGSSAEHQALDKAAVDNARQSAKLMSKAFHAAAEQVLPAVVTITSKPTVVKASGKPAPDEGDDGMEEIPFGFNGSPFGDMFKDPQLRQFFKNSRHAERAARRFRQRLGRDRRSVRHHSYQ